jgi:chromate transporter
LWQLGWFFAKLAVVSFGGAYAALGYMAQAAVQQFHWLSPAEMANGLGLAETTPGPLILVTQFVGFIAAWRMPAPFTPLVAGVLGAALTCWMTFAPCFLWIFSAAPWLDRIEGAPRLRAALAAITAAVVGVIAQLALWFAGAVLVPAGHPDWRALAIAAGAGLLLFALRRRVVEVVALAALAGLVLQRLVS